MLRALVQRLKLSAWKVGDRGFKETKCFLLRSPLKIRYCGEPLQPRGSVLQRASCRQGSNFVFSVWRAVSSHSPHHPQEVPLAQHSQHVQAAKTPLISFLFRARAVVA